MFARRLERRDKGLGAFQSAAFEVALCVSHSCSLLTMSLYRISSDNFNFSLLGDNLYGYWVLVNARPISGRSVKLERSNAKDDMPNLMNSESWYRRQCLSNSGVHMTKLLYILNNSRFKHRKPRYQLRLRVSDPRPSDIDSLRTSSVCSTQ